jgi:hypothetical protein
LRRLGLGCYQDCQSDMRPPSCQGLGRPQLSASQCTKVTTAAQRWGEKGGGSISPARLLTRGVRLQGTGSCRADRRALAPSSYTHTQAGRLTYGPPMLLKRHCQHEACASEGRVLH